MGHKRDLASRGAANSLNPTFPSIRFHIWSQKSPWQRLAKAAHCRGPSTIYRKEYDVGLKYRKLASKWATKQWIASATNCCQCDIELRCWKTKEDETSIVAGGVGLAYMVNVTMRILLHTGFNRLSSTTERLAQTCTQQRKAKKL